MATLVVFLVVLLVLDVLVLAGRTPDTHREITQHGDYQV